FKSQSAGLPFVLVGLGKMAYCLSREIEREDLLVDPFIVTKKIPSNPISSWKIVTGSHPDIGSESLSAGRELLSYIDKAQSSGDHEMLVALTGGASALAEVLPNGVSETFIFKLNKELLRSGADIEEVNKIRQEFSSLKNGGLLTFTKAKVVHTFITSDIPSGDYEKVGSSPTIYREPNFNEIRSLIKDLLSIQLKNEALGFLESEERSKLVRKKEKAFREKLVHSYLVADYKKLSKNLKHCFKDKIIIREKPYACQMDQAVKEHLLELKNILRGGDLKSGGFYLTGGETPVLVKGKGLGGRNTEFVLRMSKAVFFDNILKLEESVLEMIALASFGTDGTDGETSAAGAWFDFSAFLKVKKSGLDVDKFLTDNDSYSFFAKTGHLIKIDGAEVNIMDLRIILLKSKTTG
ncbi:MAG: hypothetical protein CME68_09940, partial [Halobacteriovoraceae bacterium]|nr:hypothetical protein [Halobacteriovoraceae bacterium]